MSRVHNDQKYMNVSHVPGAANASRVTVSKDANADYHKATTLKSWLFLKYDMSYKTYRNKKKERRIQLQEEYKVDTGNLLHAEKQAARYRDNMDDWDEVEDAMRILEGCGVPFGPDGCPLGCGWDD